MTAIFYINPSIYLHFRLNLRSTTMKPVIHTLHNIEGWAQGYGNSNIFLKPLFRGNLDPFVNNANLGAIAHTSNGT